MLFSRRKRVPAPLRRNMGWELFADVGLETGTKVDNVRIAADQKSSAKSRNTEDFKSQLFSAVSEFLELYL